MSDLMTLMEVGGPVAAFGGGAAYLRARHPAAYWSAIGLPMSTVRLLGSYGSTMDACGLTRSAVPAAGVGGSGDNSP